MEQMVGVERKERGERRRVADRIEARRREERQEKGERGERTEGGEGGGG